MFLRLITFIQNKLKVKAVFQAKRSTDFVKIIFQDLEDNFWEIRKDPISDPTECFTATGNSNSLLRMFF